MQRDYPGEFQEQTGAGAAIVGSYKPYGVERFRVVMRAQQKQWRCVSLAGELGNQICEPDLTPRGIVTEGLSHYLPTGAAELVLDVMPGFFNGFRSSRAWSEIDQSLNVGERFLTRKFFPDFCLRRRRRIRTNDRSESKQD